MAPWTLERYCNYPFPTSVWHENSISRLLHVEFGKIRTGGSLSGFIEFVEFIGFIEFIELTQATQQT